VTFVAGRVPVFGLLTALITWSTPSKEPSDKTPLPAVRPQRHLGTNLASARQHGATVVGDSDRLGAAIAPLLR
jgi:hypothetical protein